MILTNLKEEIGNTILSSNRVKSCIFSNRRDLPLFSCKCMFRSLEKEEEEEERGNTKSVRNIRARRKINVRIEIEIERDTVPVHLKLGFGGGRKWKERREDCCFSGRSPWSEEEERQSSHVADVERFKVMNGPPLAETSGSSPGCGSTGSSRATHPKWPGRVGLFLAFYYGLGCKLDTSWWEPRWIRT